MKTNELKNKSAAELKKSLLELLKEQFTLRMQKKLSEVKSTHRFKQIRREIARIKTYLNQQRSA